MDKYKLTLEERESIISWDESCSVCTIYTCSKSMQAKCDKFCHDSPENWKLISNDAPSKTYQTNKSFISFKGSKRKMSDEQRKTNAERLRIARENKAQ